MRVRPWTLRAAVPGVALLIAAGAVPATSFAAPSAPTATAPATAGLRWGPCSTPALAGFQCARLVVAADPDDPAAGTFSLAVARHRATGTAAERKGSLFFNPGGPGGSGLQALMPVWALMPDSIKRRFDVVTWDPRGIGSTTPALSGCTAPLTPLPATGRVDWDAVLTRYRSEVAAANTACYETNKAFIDHMSTNDAVRDLDALRAAVGDAKLTYWGMSYGTRIGYVYAMAYPTKVRAIVQDGSIDPVGSIAGFLDGATGPDLAYGLWAQRFPKADRRFRAALRTLGRTTLVLPGGRVLTRWDVLGAVFGTVGSQFGYRHAADVAAYADSAANRTGQARRTALAKLAEIFGPAAPSENAGGAFAVVNCLDYPDRPDAAEQKAMLHRAIALAPRYGAVMQLPFGSNCEGLPVKPDPVPMLTSNQPRTPVLVLGATRDASTHPVWSDRMARGLPGSRQVTYVGGQHVTWLLAGSSCVNRFAQRWVIARVLPAVDQVCPYAGP